MLTALKPGSTLEEEQKDRIMKTNNFVVICLRLLGIYFGVMGLSSLPSVISMFVEASTNMHTYFFISPIILIASGLVLYIYARKIGRHIMEFSEAEEDGLHITVSEQSTRIALLILGIFVFAQSLPQLIQISFDVGLYYKNIGDVPKVLRETDHRWTYLIGPVLKLVIAFILILGPDKIIAFLSNFDQTFRKIKTSHDGAEQDEQ